MAKTRHINLTVILLVTLDVYAFNFFCVCTVKRDGPTNEVGLPVVTGDW